MEAKATPKKTTAKKVTYSRLPEDAHAADDLDDGGANLPYVSSHGVGRERAGSSKNNNLRKHEIYDNTYYIPNTKVRILETPMSSSLSFQMLLYYHFFYNVFYLCVIFTTLIYKLWVLTPNIIDILALIIGVIIWFPVELARLNFAYKGNINETVRLFENLNCGLVPRVDRLHHLHDLLHHPLQHRPLHPASQVPSRDPYVLHKLHLHSV